MFNKKISLDWLNELSVDDQNLYGKYIKCAVEKNYDWSFILKYDATERQKYLRFYIQKFIVNVIVADKIKKWARDFCKLKHIDCFNSFDGSITITLYYSSEKALRSYMEKGVSENLKKQVLKYLEEEGYFKCFPNGQYEWFGQKRDYVVIEFDSYERIKKECQGIYQWRYR